MTDVGFGCVLEFDRHGREFALGVEVGRLWEQMKDPERFEQEIHADNAEMVMRMAEQTGREFAAKPMDDNWMLLRVEAA